MGATLTVTETTTEMVHLKGGALVQEESEREWYMVPPKAEYEFEITGYAVPFEMKVSEEYGGGTQTKTRLEFTIKGGKGDGKRFTDMFTFSIGPKSNLGALLRRLNVSLDPDPETRQWDLDRVIGYKGKGYVTHGADKLGVVKLDEKNKPKYAKLVLDTVEAVAAPTTAYRCDIVETLTKTTPDDVNQIQNDEWPEN